VKQNRIVSTWVFLLFICTMGTSIARSKFRKVDSSLPCIKTRFVGNNNYYSLTNSHLEEYPIFKIFDKDFFFDNLLPNQPIPVRNHSDQMVDGAQLKTLIEELLVEIKQKKKTFTHFIVLQNKDFNEKKQWGLMVLKFKDYPYVLKLFIETPESFVRPFDKGFEPIFFFLMGGGVNRHLTGFTRIKNAHYLRDLLKTDAYWSQHIDIPNKWFWLPKQESWIEIVGYNIGSQPIQTIQIPGTYAIIADAICEKDKLSLWQKDHRQMALNLCNFTDLYIDPHIKNFMIEDKTNLLVIVDTEHFPSVVGFKQVKHYHSYSRWFSSLVAKCTRDIYFRDKTTRRKAQYDSQLYITQHHIKVC